MNRKGPALKIRTLNHVNSHWSDGRHLSAGAGSEVWIDDTDADAVAHAKHLVATGQAEIVAEPEPDAEPEPEQEEPEDVEVGQPGPPFRAAYEAWTLADLIAEAESRGLPKYGTKADIAERLREDDDAETGTDEPAVAE